MYPIIMSWTSLLMIPTFLLRMWTIFGVSYSKKTPIADRAKDFGVDILVCSCDTECKPTLWPLTYKTKFSGTVQQTSNYFGDRLSMIFLFPFWRIQTRIKVDMPTFTKTKNKIHLAYPQTINSQIFTFTFSSSGQCNQNREQRVFFLSLVSNGQRVSSVFLWVSDFFIWLPVVCLVKSLLGFYRLFWLIPQCVQELCESRGGRPGLSILTSLLASVDVMIYWTMLRHWSQLVPSMSADIWGH